VLRVHETARDDAIDDAVAAISVCGGAAPDAFTTTTARWRTPRSIGTSGVARFRPRTGDRSRAR
jgi:hypothetical protein